MNSGLEHLFQRKFAASPSQCTCPAAALRLRLLKTAIGEASRSASIPAGLQNGRSFAKYSLSKEGILYGLQKRNRVDRRDLESDSWLHEDYPRLQKLLRRGICGKVSRSSRTSVRTGF